MKNTTTICDDAAIYMLKVSMLDENDNLELELLQMHMSQNDLEGCLRNHRKKIVDFEISEILR